ncbi:gene transfer agent family protein [Tistrella bauzanensis]|uniref:gene transfer agent family protein n=1 Tax=Tistrella TaxID=171436 RepID=UPI0031F67DA4
MTERATDGTLRLLWGDGRHPWRLGIAQLAEIEAVLDIGVYALQRRIGAHDWRIADLRQVARLALIGGGMTPDRALRMVETYIEPDRWPLLDTAAHCNAVLLLALVGPTDAHTGRRKRPAPRGNGAADEMTASVSPASMDTGLPSDGTPARSTG